MWGSCDLAADTFAVTIGLPVESLTTLGVKPGYLPQNYVMPSAFVDDNTISIAPGAARFPQLMLRQEVLKQQGGCCCELVVFLTHSTLWYPDQSQKILLHSVLR